MKIDSSHVLKKLRQFLLPFLVVIFLMLMLALFNKPKPKRSNAEEKNSRAKTAVARFLRRRIDLKTIAGFKAPIGTIYELRSLDKKFYFQVEKKTAKVTYASIGDIKIRPTTKTLINRIDAQNIALKFARSHSEQFKNFSLDPDQADYFWPKPTYWTVIWRHRSTKGHSGEFAKVTVDAVSGQVVSFGIGSDQWSSFCLPDKKQAPWADK